MWCTLWVKVVHFIDEKHILCTITLLPFSLSLSARVVIYNVHSESECDHHFCCAKSHYLVCTLFVQSESLFFLIFCIVLFCSASFLSIPFSECYISWINWCIRLSMYSERILCMNTTLVKDSICMCEWMCEFVQHIRLNMCFLWDKFQSKPLYVVAFVVWSSYPDCSLKLLRCYALNSQYTFSMYDNGTREIHCKTKFVRTVCVYRKE